MDTCDVAIVGGGVIGSACAYFLAADPAFAGRILVVEPDPTYATCATARSWGGVRQQFSTPENVQMSLFGAAFVRAAAETLAVDGDRPALGFREQGYLFLASEAGWPLLQANVALQNRLGAEIELLPRDDLGRRFPWLAVECLAGGGFGRRNEGWIDAYSLLQAFRRKAAALGVAYRRDRVVAVESAHGRVAGIRLAGGDGVAAPVVVNAAGPAAGRIAALAGIDLPVGPRKRMTYVFDCRRPPPRMPLTIDVSGVATRPEGAQFLAILSPPPEADRDADPDDFALDDGPFEETIWPILAARIPAFEAVKLVRSWAGHYDYNALDQNAVIGPHPALAGFYFCNGFSGHGVQQSPAAGRAIAELILHGGFRTIDLTRFGYARIAAGRPLAEQNVV